MAKRKDDQDHLSRNRDGIWVWRRVDPITGRRTERSTGMRRRTLAQQAARKFEEEWERKKVGLPSYEWSDRELRPLVKLWLDELRADGISDKTFDQKAVQMERAFKALDLTRAVDLLDLSRIARTLTTLREENGMKVPPGTLRRCYQAPLKQFSRWAATDRKHFPEDPLACWGAIKLTKAEKAARREKTRQTYLPDFMARALLALDVLDALNRREVPTAPVYRALLVTAPRAEALTSRKVEHFRPDLRLIDSGRAVGNKGRGAGALDPVTNRLLSRYVGERKEGALFLSPWGVAWTKERLLDCWREGYSYGLVDALFPIDLRHEKTERMIYLVSTALLCGQPKVSRGGSRLTVETISARESETTLATKIADGIREEWTRHFKRRDVHAFRKTHRTWAEKEGVPGAIIDKQLGHDGSKAQETRADFLLLAGSRTGRQFYRDLDSALLPAERSAEAVAKLLDVEIERLREDADSIFGALRVRALPKQA